MHRAPVKGLLAFGLVSLSLTLLLGLWRHTEGNARESSALFVAGLFVLVCWSGALIAGGSAIRSAWQRNRPRFRHMATWCAALIVIPLCVLFVLRLVPPRPVRERFPNVDFNQVRIDCLALMDEADTDAFLWPDDPRMPESAKRLNPHCLEATWGFADVASSLRHFVIVPDDDSPHARGRKVTTGLYFWEEDD